MLNMKKNKIIGIGFHKTGTTTLGNALKILGYKVKGVTPRMIIPVVSGKTHKALNYAEKYDALEDVPWCILYKELYRRFPESKFILTIRDEESWFKSAKKQFGNYIRPQNEWIYGRGNGLFKDKELAITRYRKHNKDVTEYFKDKPNKLLIMNFSEGDGWGKLCTFLGKDIPNIPFPHSNKTSDKSGKNSFKEKFKTFRRVVKNTVKVKYADIMGYWNN